MSGAPPLVVLGFDAGDPGLLVRWADAGHLPTLARVLEDGCWARTAGPELVCEHGTWVSLTSGVSRGRHGYYYYRQLVPGTYDLRTVTGRDVTAAPFWASLRGTGRRAAIFDVPDVVPVPGLAGVQLADWAVHNPSGPPVTEPPDLLRRAPRVARPSAPIHERPGASPATDRRILRRLLERARRKGELCRALVEGGRWDLVVAVFGESHTASHQFWKYLENGGAAEELVHAIRLVHIEIDRQMGRLLDVLPREANVVILSSTGMKPQYPTGGLAEAFLRGLGYQVGAVRDQPSWRPLDVARRWIPDSWRVAASRGLPREARERLLADGFRGATDWSRTRAFAIPSAYTSFLRVNLRGREPRGVVEPGAEYDALLASLEADLAALVDPATGGPAVLRVARATDLFGGGPPVTLPDLFVEWQPSGRFVRRLLHPRAELTQERPEFCRDSDHSDAGFLAASGPAVEARGFVGEMDLLDVAPSLVGLLEGKTVTAFGPRRVAPARG